MIRISAPNKSIKTHVSIAGSKSLSNRLLMIRAISGLNIHFKNLSDSDDTIVLAKILGSIQGKTNAIINVGHAGTDMRFLTAFLANKEGEWLITGSERMQQRPIGELVNVLRNMGAQIDYAGNEGYPPLKIKGTKLKGGSVEIDGGVSSQFITALLLIGPTLTSGLILKINGSIVSRPYIKMTIELMKQYGVLVVERENSIEIAPSKYINNGSEFYVESDWSSASYWYSIAALSNESEISLDNFSKKSLQADSVASKIFEKLGVKTEWTKNGLFLTKQNVEVSEFEFDFNDCPDIAQTVAATCAGLGIKANLTGLQTLKVKETDRINATKIELEKFGVKIDANSNSLCIHPIDTLLHPNAVIQTYHDHRVAMSLAPLALVTNGFRMIDPDVVNKSYAAFWDDLQEAGFDIG